MTSEMAADGVKFAGFHALWKYVFMGLLVATLKVKGSSVMQNEGAHYPHPHAAATCWQRSASWRTGRGPR